MLMLSDPQQREGVIAANPPKGSGDIVSVRRCPTIGICVTFQEEDVSMADTAMVENGTPEAEDEITVDDHRIRIVSFIWPADLSYVC